MDRHVKFVVQFKHIVNVNVDDVKKCFNKKLNYVGIYTRNNSTLVYIQTQNSVKIASVSILKKIKGLGEIQYGPSPFTVLEGDCVESEGVLTKRGRSKGSKIKHGHVVNEFPKPNKLKIPVINEEQDRVLPTPKKYKKFNVAAPMRFFPVYTGYNRKWEIVSWFPETESIRRNTSSFRDILLEKQDHKCNYCDCIVNFGEYSNADVDHKIPLNCGGGSYIDNLQVLCVMCHRYKTALETKSRTMTKSIEEMGLE